MFLQYKVIYSRILIYTQVAVSNSVDFNKPQNRTQTIKMSKKPALNLNHLGTTSEWQKALKNTKG